MAYERLLREFGLTQEELARQLGKSQSTVANKLRLLRLAPEVQARLAAPVFTERHARALLALRDVRNQVRVADAICSRDLTVRQTEELVERLSAEEAAGGSLTKTKPTQNWRAVFRDARILSNTFRSAVSRLRQAGMAADLEEVEREEGLEIRVLVHLPKGWREGKSRRPAANEDAGDRPPGRRRRSQ
jgi:ParB family chromosome partitioning protein